LRQQGGEAGAALPGDLAAGARAPGGGDGAADGLWAAARVEQLLGRTNRFGPASLGDRRRGNGAKATGLTPAVLDKLRARLTTPPEGGGVWTAKKVAAVMAAELGLASVAEPRGWEALRALGWTIQKPRPRHARAASPEEQEDYKTSSPQWSPKRRSATPAR